ncbi:putative MFS family arabinose efflux permease [Luteibacter sp. OK325]|uniref:MFS transporter n=1 Tax=Luteibacter sp. OK325 TaxID=2135670 RepID=UPI000D34BD2D|nr:MFS transporter [Luteibacter sp. OK325]PTR34074.1 putative MFS family arabinose efflux permease [Luteibacter sp. OK325]
MTTQYNFTEDQEPGVLAPMGVPVFRNIWAGNLLTNLGVWAQSVAVAWVIAAAHAGPIMVAMVQVAATAPLVVLLIPAGVLADNYDKRTIMLVGQVVEMSGAIFLTVLAFLGYLDPTALILAVLWIALGSAITEPAWQAAVGEQVPRHMVGAAVLLNGVNYNVARAVGPALGGLMLSSLAPSWVFLVSTLTYIGLLVGLWRWRHAVAERSLPPEGLREGVVAAMRFTWNSTVTRLAMLRSFMFGFVASVIWALLPLVARERHDGSAALYGYMLGTLGVGAILGSVLVPRLRHWLGSGRLISAAGAVLSVVLVLLAYATPLPVLLPALGVAGACWITALTEYNANVQILVPDWVKGRALALYQTALYAGLAIGSFLWGHLAETMGVSGAILSAAIVSAVSVLLLYHSQFPQVDAAGMSPVMGSKVLAPGVAFNHERGEVVTSIEYVVSGERTDEFVSLTVALRHLRLRNGGRFWGLFRDIHDEEVWREVFLIESWLQHLRMLDRLTLADKAVIDQVMALHRGPAPPRVQVGVTYESIDAQVPGRPPDDTMKPVV